MISKIRSVMQTEELVSKVLKRLTEQNNKIGKLETEMQNFQKKLKALATDAQETNRRQKESLKAFNQVVSKIESDQERLNNAVTDFNIQKSRASQKIVEQLRTDIAHFTDVLRTDVRSFDRLKSEVDSITNQLDNAKSEITRFHEISKRLKSSDFELTRYIRKVQEMDREKLTLMKKIDSLERMVAKERRKH